MSDRLKKKQNKKNNVAQIAQPNSCRKNAYLYR